MKNYLSLDAVITAADAVRYTPAGIPVRDLTLEHTSEQEEAGAKRKSMFRIDAKIIGNQARESYNTGNLIHADGFLNLRNPNYPKLILHIQNIEILNKG